MICGSRASRKKFGNRPKRFMTSSVNSMTESPAGRGMAASIEEISSERKALAGMKLTPARSVKLSLYIRRDSASRRPIRKRRLIDLDTHHPRRKYLCKSR